MATDGHTPDTVHLLKQVNSALNCANNLTAKLRDAATLEPTHADWWQEKAEEAASINAGKLVHAFRCHDHTPNGSGPSGPWSYWRVPA